MQNKQEPAQINKTAPFSCSQCVVNEFSIEDLTLQLKKVSANLLDEKESTNQIEQENCVLQSSIVVLQKTLNDKEIVICTLEDYIKRCDAAKQVLSANVLEAQSKYKILTMASNTLQCQLYEANNSTDQMERKLNEECQMLNVLQKKILSVEQQLTSKINKLRITQEQLIRLSTEFDQLGCTNDTLKKSAIIFKSENVRLQENIRELNEKIDSLSKNNVDDLKNELKVCQNHILNLEKQKKKLEDNTTQLTNASLFDRDKYKNIRQEKEEQLNKLNLLNEKLSYAQNRILELEKENDRIDAVLVNSKQLCEGCEENRHLKVLLNVLKSEHEEKCKRFEITYRTLLQKVSDFF